MGKQKNFIGVGGLKILQLQKDSAAESLDRAIDRVFPRGTDIIVREHDRSMPGVVVFPASDGRVKVRALRGKQLVHHKHWSQIEKA